MKNSRKFAESKGFTLIELLIVIVILGVLALAVILILNPAEMLKKGRDSTRLSDMTTLRSAISLYISDVSPLVMGNEDDVYCSKDDTACPAECLLADGVTPSCVAAADLYKNNDDGWIPINFGSISSGAPISHLPIDPTNSATNAQYYRYECDASSNFEIDCVMESNYYKTGGTDDVGAKDGGNNSTRYEVGTDLTLLPAT